MLYHVMLGASHNLFEKNMLIPELELEKEVEIYRKGDSEERHFSSAMSHVEVIPVRECENSYLSMLLNHSIIEAQRP